MRKYITLSVFASVFLISGAHASEVTGQLNTGLTGSVGSTLTGTVSTPTPPSSGGGGGGGGSSHSSTHSSVSSKKAGAATVTTSTNSYASTTQSTQGQVKGATTYAFARDLHIGLFGADVIELQTELIAAGYGIPAGATGYFGSQTRAAVIAWQVAQHIVPAAGYFGQISRGVFVQNGSFGMTKPTT